MNYAHRFLNHVYQKRINLLIVLLTSLALQLYGQKLDLESVKRDFLSADLEIPENYINDGQGIFSEFYLGETALVHLRYKRVEEPALKCTFVAAYKLSKLKKWILHEFVPYYYNIKLIDADLRIFLTENQFCSMGGRCAYYSEFSQFHDGEFIDLLDCGGFNEQVYYETELVQFEKDASEVLGDTITDVSYFRNIKFNGEILSVDIERRIAVLKGVKSDSLILQKSAGDVLKKNLKLAL